MYLLVWSITVKKYKETEELVYSLQTLDLQRYKVFVNLTQTQVPGKRESRLRNCLHQIECVSGSFA